VQDRSVVDQHVDSAQVSFDALDGCDPVGLNGHVEMQIAGVCCDLLTGALSLLVANVSHHDARAFDRETLSDDKSRPTSRPGDQRNLAFEHAHERTLALITEVSEVPTATALSAMMRPFEPDGGADAEGA
jgi:hypothetical protein